MDMFGTVRRRVLESIALPHGPSEARPARCSRKTSRMRAQGQLSRSMPCRTRAAPSRPWRPPGALAYGEETLHVYAHISGGDPQTVRHVLDDLLGEPDLNQREEFHHRPRDVPPLLQPPLDDRRHLRTLTASGVQRPSVRERRRVRAGLPHRPRRHDCTSRWHPRARRDPGMARGSCADLSQTVKRDGQRGR